MPSSYVVSLVVAALAVILLRLVLPVPARSSGAGWVDAVLVFLGGLGLTFHCGAMFYRSTVDAVPGTSGLVDAVHRMGTASMIVALIALATVDLFAGGRTTGLRSSSPRSRRTA